MQIRELSSIRGIAAIVVVLEHVFFIIDRNAAGNNDGTGAVFTGAVFDILGNILNGNAAVELFFVLSGLVLSLSLEHGRDRLAPWLLSFYVRRVFRIYPALWVSLALGLLLLPFERGSCIDGFCTEFARAAFGTDFTGSQIILSFAGVSSRINGPMWSLRTELLYSLLMPGIFWALRRDKVRWLFVLFVFAISVGPFPRIYSLHYAAAFTLGSAIPLLHLEKRKSVFAGLLLVGLGVMVFDRLLLMPFDVDLKTFELIEICAAFFIVYPIYHGKVDLKFLRGARIFYIGEISYSIYILHWSLLYAITYALKKAAGPQDVLVNPNVYTVVLGAVTLLLVLILSAVDYHCVEMPCQALGKRLSGRFRVRRPDTMLDRRAARDLT